MPLDADKPKRSSLPKGWSPASLELEQALRLLALPREVGVHPEDGKLITAGLGRYGPFVLHAGTYANVSDIDEVFEVGLNRAVALLAEKRAGRPGRGSAVAPLKELGEHPEDKAPVQVMAGRFGPYVKWGKVNATLPKGTAPEDMTLEAALPLLAEKRAGRPGRGSAVAPLKELGEHPEDKAPVQVMAGRFGPYVKWGKVNATLPKGTAPEDMTLEAAIPLLAERAAKAPAAKTKKAPAKKAAPKKAAAKKPAAKKAPAKKKAAAED
ncbi:MAG: hypothetical protein EON86_16680 [Brevundimonas sp.]|nr:MAG: hypothetical protein EON86_16680 [Brevundimonas sp.]